MSRKDKKILAIVEIIFFITLSLGLAVTTPLLIYWVSVAIPYEGNLFLKIFLWSWISVWTIITIIAIIYNHKLIKMLIKEIKNNYE